MNGPLNKGNILAKMAKCLETQVAGEKFDRSLRQSTCDSGERCNPFGIRPLAPDLFLAIVYVVVCPYVCPPIKF